MRIKNQYILSIIVFGVILAVISASAFITYEQVTRVSNEELTANSINTDASNLAYISNAYFLNKQGSQVTLWQNQYSAVSSELSGLNSNSQQLQVQINNVNEDLQNLGSIFNSSVAYVESIVNQTGVVHPILQFDTDNLNVQNQALAFDASILSKSFENQANQLRDTNTFLIFVLLGAFATYFVAVYFVFYRRTLRSIKNLRDGTRIIGSGNLDYAIAPKSNDEIGELSSAFNQMTASLKNVTASKSDLEKEVEERKKAEKELNLHRQNLEKLVEERTKQLKDSERLAAIGATAGMVGHDIRNPLQAITSDVYLAKTDLAIMPETEEKKNVQESLEEIAKNVVYINKIVADLQDFARPIAPKFEEVDLEETIHLVLAQLNIPGNVTVNHSVKRGFPKFNTDPAYMQRILTNLANNAIQAMPQGGKLSIAAVANSGKAIITVEDNGEGIPENVRDKLFTPLVTTKSKGQGFGLSVVKRFTEGLGGTVTFESEVGKGTKFIIELPL